LIAGDRYRDANRDGTRIDAIIVDPILKFISAIRHCSNSVPRQPFRLVEQGVGAGAEPLNAIAADQINQAPFTCGACR